MKLGDWNDAGLALAIDRLRPGVECAHGHGSSGRVSRDAVLAGAEDGMNAIEAGERRAAGAWIALVAGFCDVIKIVTARSLQQIAAGGGLVSQLGARACQQCAAQDAVALPHAAVGREI